ncbi:Fpg/Nei family DNA glycosylase [Phycicoccus endophyticus]|uniref:Fpg/Nei family DNA glycosylase n=1 Tax=Phycicoccus endophyticus TaxID=1690220 RepID=A0A7G9R150_9MICO|nr:Fpg/Nei family DNA glycosylase [Phycicoccus endophyticus]NHI20545.1 Fpg/Nei family DNA glycosylase [Phycicoccus endophyticus]QNN49325.1 Fpg/Nei family DNA glycosylase [Phycicoccus endophyticus]GGL45374.1 formamidopyrimidine-DNA glycosylase [Phycicoccus endophyticus]
MPELPEVQALADFLRQRTDGLVVTGVELGSFHVLKTFTPPPEALVGAPVDGVARHGKFLDLDCGGTHLVVHLARAGWLRWSDAMPSTVLRPGKSPIALRVRFDDASGFDLTEAGTQKRLAAYVVHRPEDVPGVASLGPDPLADGFTEEVFAGIVGAHRMQVKGLLRDQSVIAGVGNAYSDEILHVAKLSPFAIAASLDDAQVTRLYAALRETLARAVAAASGKPAKELKDAKRAGMRVHGRTGEPCPECGDVVREVSFADSSLQYCATCQTGGKPLADRRTSKFLK